MYAEPMAAALSRAPGSALAHSGGPRPKASGSVESALMQQPYAGKLLPLTIAWSACVIFGPWSVPQTLIVNFLSFSLPWTLACALDLGSLCPGPWLVVVWGLAHSALRPGLVGRGKYFVTTAGSSELYQPRALLMHATVSCRGRDILKTQAAVSK